MIAKVRILKKDNEKNRTSSPDSDKLFFFGINIMKLVESMSGDLN